jgi:hypothetical protein
MREPSRGAPWEELFRMLSVSLIIDREMYREHP